MDDFPKASRPSKLKRRRRNQQSSSSTNSTTNSNNNNPLAKFSAGVPAAVQSKNNHKHILAASSEHVAMEYEPQKSIPTLASSSRRDGSFVLKELPLASTILDLSNSSGGNAKAVSAQIDNFITLASNQNCGKIVRKHDDDDDDDHVQGGNIYNNGRVHHSILGTVDLLHRQRSSSQISNGAHFGYFPLAFPKIDAADNIKVNDNDSYRRGDGVLVASDCLSLPVVCSLRNNGNGLSQWHVKYIKIVSQYGATIRTLYEIDDNHDASLAIGKLNFGEIRAIVESKWLDPPEADMSGDGIEYDDEKLVGVVRYKVRLFSSDIYKINDAEKTSSGSGKGKGLFGWISDRSRLEDDPFVIAQIQE